MSKNFELDLTDLRCICDPVMFNFKDTSEVEPLDGVIGQERAVRAIDFGLNMRSPGYNIFVTGIEGTGKSTIVRDIVNRHAKPLPTPDDWCMVNNFKDEYVPKAIAVPHGKAVKFSRTMNKMIEDLKTELPKAFQDETYQQRQATIQQRFADQRRDIYKTLEKFAEERNLRIQRTATGYQPIPFYEGKPLSTEDFQALPEEKREEIEENLRTVRAETESIVREVAKINKNMQKNLEKLMEEIALYVVRDRINDIKEEFKESARILTYLDEVRDDIVENVKDFIAVQEDTDAAKVPLFHPPKPTFNRYQVNVLVDRRGMKGAPVIFETNPTYQNVFGQIEKRAVMGTLMTDFTMVKAGSLLKANGGFLVMEIESVITSPFV